MSFYERQLNKPQVVQKRMFIYGEYRYAGQKNYRKRVSPQDDKNESTDDKSTERQNNYR